MKIVHEKPWFFALLERFNPNAEWGKVAFTWGDTIYASHEVKDYVIEHEKVHIKHQKGSKIYGIFVIALYNFSPKFRLECEVEAYRAELEYFKKHEYSIERIERARRSFATALSSPLYGNIISYQEALKLL